MYLSSPVCLRGESMFVRRAFTLIELLVAIAVIGVLAGLFISAIGKVKDQARRISCASMLRQWGLGLRGYAIDNDQQVPGSCSGNFAGPKAMLIWATAAQAVAQGRGEEITFSVMQEYLDMRNSGSGSSSKINVSCPAIGAQRWSGSGAFFDLGYAYFGRTQTWSPKPELCGNATLGYNLLGSSRLESNRLIMMDKVMCLATADTGLRWLNHTTNRTYGSASGYQDGEVPQNLLAGANLLFGDGHVSWYAGGTFNLPPVGTRPNTYQNVAGNSYVGKSNAWAFFPPSQRW